MGGRWPMRGKGEILAPACWMDRVGVMWGEEVTGEQWLRGRGEDGLEGFGEEGQDLRRAGGEQARGQGVLRRAGWGSRERRVGWEDHELSTGAGWGNLGEAGAGRWQKIGGGESAKRGKRREPGQLPTEGAEELLKEQLVSGEPRGHRARGTHGGERVRASSPKPAVQRTTEERSPGTLAPCYARAEPLAVVGSSAPSPPDSTLCKHHCCRC